MGNQKDTKQNTELAAILEKLTALEGKVSQLQSENDQLKTVSLASVEQISGSQGYKTNTSWGYAGGLAMVAKGQYIDNLGNDETRFLEDGVVIRCNVPANEFVLDWQEHKTVAADMLARAQKRAAQRKAERAQAKRKVA